MANYFESFSPSFGAKSFTLEEIPGINYKASENFNFSNIDFTKVANVEFNPIAFDQDLNLLSDNGWTFITAPEDISWNVNNQADRVNIFGTNSPPVVAGTRGMRDLSLNNSLVEGFVRRVTVEDKIFALEQLMNYSLNPTDGFVQVPVYQVWANEKAYGKGYFIIKDIKVQEKMRDLKGNATRATVDISFMEVPEYQVNSGRDLASQPAAAATARALPDRNATKAAQEAAQKAAVNGKVDKGVNATTKAGPGAGGTSTPATVGKNKGPRGTTAYDLNITNLNTRP